MKRIGMYSLLTMLLVMALLLTSCGGGATFASFDKVLNPDYDVTVENLKKAEAVTELEGYSVLTKEYDTVIFSKLNEETGVLAYKVYNLRNAKVILTFAEQNATYAFNTQFVDLGVLLVTQSKYNEPEDASVVTNPEDLYEVTCFAYDATGAELAKNRDALEEDPFLLGDLVVLHDVAYTVDAATGAFTKAMDLPEYAVIREGVDFRWNDDYCYVMSDQSIFVYDRTFDYVSSWTLPSYAEPLGKHVLNNGDLLVQYVYELESNVKEYDYYETKNGESIKYDLVTLLIKAKNGSTKDIDLEAIVRAVDTNYELYDEEDDNNRFNDAFDNIAYIYPIVNQKVDISDAAEDVVLISDSGKLRKSLKLVDGQTAMLPQKLDGHVYLLEMLHGGIALVDLNGTVLQTVNAGASPLIVGQYIVLKKAIYDFNLDVIYSLTDNDAMVVGVVDETVFVQAGTEDAYTVYAFCDGEQKTVYTYDVKSEENGVFQFVEDGQGNAVGYVILNAAGDYTYYNAKGEALITTTAELQAVLAYGDTVLYVASTTVETVLKLTYYVFTKKKTTEARRKQDVGYFIYANSCRKISLPMMESGSITAS